MVSKRSASFWCAVSLAALARPLLYPTDPHNFGRLSTLGSPSKMNAAQRFKHHPFLEGGKQAIEGGRANGRSQGTKKEGRRQVADDHGASSHRQFLRCLQAKLREVFILNRFARAKANQLSDRLRVGPGDQSRKR